MAAEDHTREQSRLELTIEAERGKLLQANAVQRCLYEVLLYADGEDTVTYAEAAHVVATLIDDCVARLDIVQLRPQIEELRRDHIHQYAGSSSIRARPTTESKTAAPLASLDRCYFSALAARHSEGRSAGVHLLVSLQNVAD